MTSTNMSNDENHCKRSLQEYYEIGLQMVKEDALESATAQKTENNENK